MKLCYKDYPIKMSLGAIKQFKQATGYDLWSTLLQFIDVFHATQGDTIIGRMKTLYDVCDFETGSHMFHALIQAEDKSIPLEEVQDAMFRVGWLPHERDDDMSDPWALVAISAANEIDTQFKRITSKKKADI